MVVLLVFLHPHLLFEPNDTPTVALLKPESQGNFDSLSRPIERVTSLLKGCPQNIPHTIVRDLPLLEHSLFR